MERTCVQTINIMSDPFPSSPPPHQRPNCGLDKLGKVTRKKIPKKGLPLALIGSLQVPSFGTDLSNMSNYVRDPPYPKNIR